MTKYIGAYREHCPDPRFVLDEVLPSMTGFAMRWPVTVGGIDVTHLESGYITRVWSVTAGRALPTA